MMGLDGPVPSPEEKSLIEQGIGGVILFERNCRHPAQIAELIRELQEIARSRGPGIPLSIAIDQEHGPVTRIKEGITPFPSAGNMGKMGESDLVRRSARIIGRELAVTLLRGIAQRYDVVIPASPLGKAKMVAQVVAILLLILGRDHLQGFFVLGQVALWVVLVAAVFSAVDYYRRFSRAVGGARPKQESRSLD